MDIEDDVRKLCGRAKAASRLVAAMGSDERGDALIAAADELDASAAEILEANAMDRERAERGGMRSIMLDRLLLTADRVRAMSNGVRSVASLTDPTGQTLGAVTRPNGIRVAKRRVPIGVVGMIYESRPNVTSDAASLCFRAGNACVLRGGSDAANSNEAVAAAFRRGLSRAGAPEDAVLLAPASREASTAMMHMNGLIDVLIPRGGSGLIQTVVRESSVPVIETGVGNCHIYIDETADPEMAVSIVTNAKTQRPSVCNAAESLIIHRGAMSVLPAIAESLSSHGVEMRGDAEARSAVPSMVPADESDWGTEYLDLIISVKTVGSTDEAIRHIHRYGTGHSECIVTKSYDDAMKFLDCVDAAAVYVNASTRFTDGEEFGYGAEIGISTQKLHARGPMGLEALTTTKFVVYGSGQIR